MSAFYRFDQRVYLRRDTSQYGRIGRGPFSELAAKDKLGFVQFVFWEHADADIVTPERVEDLMGEQEYHERRRLFFAAMRHPEMRWVLECLKHLKHDQGIDWRAIGEIEIDPPLDGPAGTNAWLMRTDKFVSFLLWPKQYDGIEDFMTIPHHEEGNPYCECYYCYDVTLAKRQAERAIA